MKKVIILIAMFAIAATQHSFAQDTAKTQIATILNAYYQVKDALVSSDPSLAASQASILASTISAASKQPLNEDARASLSKDATAIAQSKDIKQQREKFITLSNNMVELVKSAKLNMGPIYQQYCPMKKASWLSSDKTVKNPYYGGAMLICGTVKATF